MSSNLGKNGATVVHQPGRPWSLVARLAVFYTLGGTALLLVTMVILYSVLVQHINADDNNFLADKLRAVRADLAEKKVGQGELLADDVPVGASDYFVRVLDQKTGQAVAERPGRRLPPSVFPSPPPDGQIPAQGVEYKTSGGNGFC